VTYTLDPTTRTYTSVELHTGPNDVEISEHIITDEDQGALYSWQAVQWCSESGTYGSRTYIQVDACPTEPENHLTVTHNGAVASDSIWQPGAQWSQAVQPLLQVEDGSFAGTVQTGTGSSAIAFDRLGNIRWTEPDLDLQYAVRSGGVAGYVSGVGVAFDASGSVVAPARIPQFQTWPGYVYQIGSVERVHVDGAIIARTFWPQASSTAATPQVKLRFTQTLEPPTDGSPADTIGLRLGEILEKFRTGTEPATQSCRAWLDPGQTSWTWQLPYLLDDRRYAHGIFEDERVRRGQIVRTLNETTYAAANGANPGESQSIGPQGVAILINDNGAFYKATPSTPNTKWGGLYGGNNPRVQVETLLHELAHLIRSVEMYGPNGSSDLRLPDLFENDFGESKEGTAAQRKNGKTLLKYCGKFIELAPMR
jgi:hypothetical protein